MREEGQRRGGARCHSRLARPSPGSPLLIWCERWKYTSSVLWGNPPGQAWEQHLGLGGDSGKDNPPRLGIADGAPFDRGV